MANLKTPPEDWTPDTPHTDLRRERFAQLIAGGTALSAAYKRTGTGQMSDGTARSNGWRMSREPAVVARVEWLRIDNLRQQVDDTTAFDRATMNTLMGDVTTALEGAISALENAGGNPSTIAQLRSDLVVHVGRLFRQPKAKKPHVAIGPDHIRDGLTRLQLCECDHP